MKKHSGNTGIIDGVIWKTLLAFFFPIVFGTFFQQMYNTVDAIIVGKFVGKEALAAVGGATGSLINLMVGFFVGLASGATVILSQRYGARDAAGVHHAVHTAVALALTCGFFLMVFGLVMAPTMLGWMGLQQDVMEHAVPYIRIYFAGMIPSLLYNVGTGLLRAVGDSKRPMIFLIVACMVNVVLDVLLTVGLNMGVQGAALATIISQMVSATLVMVTLIRSEGIFHLRVKKIRFHGSVLKDIVRIGLPAGLQSVLFSISNVLIQSAINGFDTNIQAAYTAYNKLDSFIWMIVNAFGISITTFVGQNFGARKLDRIRRGAYTTLGMCAGAIVAVSGLLILLGRLLLGMFTDDVAVVEAGYQMILLLIPYAVIYVPVEVFSGTVRGTGDSVAPTLITLCGICLFRVVWVSLVVPRYGTLDVLLRCYPITWALTSIGFILYYHFSGWMKRSLARADKNAG